MTPDEVESRLRAVEERIEAALARSGRSRSSLEVVCVSKKKGVEEMNRMAEALRARGLPVIFGENYVQEFRDKSAALSGAYEARLIGPLQSNKVREAVALFSMIESVHSAAVAREIDKRAAACGKRQEILLQVNVSGDPGKSGFEPSEAERFVRNEIGSLPNLALRGFMTITALYERVEDVRPDFAALRHFRDRLQELAGVRPLKISMGMSADFDIAIEEGADIVRIGTALFGER